MEVEAKGMLSEIAGNCPCPLLPSAPPPPQLRGVCCSSTATSCSFPATEKPPLSWTIPGRGGHQIATALLPAEDNFVPFHLGLSLSSVYLDDFLAVSTALWESPQRVVPPLPTELPSSFFILVFRWVLPIYEDLA